MVIYAGIGTRAVGPKTYECLAELGEALAKRGWLLRSGGADGCDSAFEEGCDRAEGEKEIYLPWKNFNGNDSKLCEPSADAFALAERVHPAWHALTVGGRKLHARNGHQILGADLQTPVHVVICWTESGLGQGGTGQALKLAIENSIPIIELGPKEIWTLDSIIERIKKMDI